ncbi:hypothetical protein EIP91_008949 [Steccherinum ochraceum]|uniref:Uncharacterized protein n=1 Tax=Steccherinum ochraceum TaxID=92696 RepID=A0A4R0RKN0_9APHY|nr:hypothetical protein EIP91_008949 [Steccherinum ochraceum]
MFSAFRLFAALGAAVPRSFENAVSAVLRRLPQLFGADIAKDEHASPPPLQETAMDDVVAPLPPPPPPPPPTRILFTPTATTLPQRPSFMVVTALLFAILCVGLFAFAVVFFRARRNRNRNTIGNNGELPLAQDESSNAEIVSRRSLRVAYCPTILLCLVHGTMAPTPGIPVIVFQLAAIPAPPRLISAILVIPAAILVDQDAQEPIDPDVGPTAFVDQDAERIDSPSLEVARSILCAAFCPTFLLCLVHGTVIFAQRQPSIPTQLAAARRPPRPVNVLVRIPFAVLIDPAACPPPLLRPAYCPTLLLARVYGHPVDRIRDNVFPYLIEDAPEYALHSDPLPYETMDSHVFLDEIIDAFDCIGIDVRTFMGAKKFYIQGEGSYEGLWIIVDYRGLRFILGVIIRDLTKAAHAWVQLCTGERVGLFIASWVCIDPRVPSRAQREGWVSTRVLPPVFGPKDLRFIYFPRWVYRLDWRRALPPAHVPLLITQGTPPPPVTILRAILPLFYCDPSAGILELFWGPDHEFTMAWIRQALTEMHIPRSRKAAERQTQIALCIARHGLSSRLLIEARRAEAVRARFPIVEDEDDDEDVIVWDLRSPVVEVLEPRFPIIEEEEDDDTSFVKEDVKEVPVDEASRPRTPAFIAIKQTCPAASDTSGQVDGFRSLNVCINARKNHYLGATVLSVQVFDQRLSFDVPVQAVDFPLVETQTVVSMTVLYNAVTAKTYHSSSFAYHRRRSTN